MALKRCFRALDTINTSLWPVDTKIPYLHYYEEYISAGQVFWERCHDAGMIWVTTDENPYGTSTINYFCPTDVIYNPGWAHSHWTFDAQYGHALTKSTAGAGLSILIDQVAVEPNMNSSFWWFGTYANTWYEGSALWMDSSFTYHTDVTIKASDYTGPDGTAPTGFLDFNIDRSNDLIFARFQGGGCDVGTVCICKISTKELLHVLYTPGTTSGIVLTNDGFVYIADNRDWMLVYDYEGRLHNAFRNPRREVYPGGFKYGWDWVYKRLLFVPGVAVGLDGASRRRIVGYYPVPDANFLSPPLPVKVPRVGRKVRVFSRIAGEGMEQLSGRNGTWSGGAAGNVSSDQHGDFAVDIVADSAGSLNITLDVMDAATPDDPAEPSVYYPGRSIVVTMLDPPQGTSHRNSPATLQASVSGATGDVTVRFHIEGPPGWLGVDGQGNLLQDMDVTVTGDGDGTYTSSFTPLPEHASNGYVVTCFVTDSTGNKGQGSNGIMMVP